MAVSFVVSCRVCGPRSRASGHLDPWSGGDMRRLLTSQTPKHPAYQWRESRSRWVLASWPRIALVIYLRWSWLRSAYMGFPHTPMHQYPKNAKAHRGGLFNPHECGEMLQYRMTPFQHFLSRTSAARFHTTLREPGAQVFGKKKEEGRPFGPPFSCTASTDLLT